MDTVREQLRELLTAALDVHLPAVGAGAVVVNAIEAR
jgi:hypothetical protein